MEELYHILAAPSPSKTRRFSGEFGATRRLPYLCRVAWIGIVWPGTVDLFLRRPLAKELAPQLEIGYIAGVALGDLSKLEVDFLMVKTSIATRRLVDAAADRGMPVHAWTVDDPDQLVRLLDRGVANVITDDPVAMRARLEEIRSLRPTARLLLRTRNLLAD